MNENIWRMDTNWSKYFHVTGTWFYEHQCLDQFSVSIYLSHSSMSFIFTLTLSLSVSPSLSISLFLFLFRPISFPLSLSQCLSLPFYASISQKMFQSYAAALFNYWMRSLINKWALIHCLITGKRWLMDYLAGYGKMFMFYFYDYSNTPLNNVLNSVTGRKKRNLW